MFFSASTLIKMQAFGHIILGGLFFLNPKTITDSSVIFLFGEAMELTQTLSFDTLSPPLAVISLFFILWGISDLFTFSALTSAQEAFEYWTLHSKLRLAFFFSIATVSCFFRSSAFETGSAMGAVVDNLGNQVTFSWSFTELVLWGWTFMKVRDEKKALESALKKRMT